MRRAAARRRRIAAGAAVTIAGIASSASAASAIEVNSLQDPGSGNCNDGTCTLREAVAQANAAPDASTITFKAGLAGKINLSSAIGAGQLDIASPMTIQGPGPGQLTISGDTGNDGTANVRVLYAFAGGGPSTISGVTIADGSGRADAASPYGEGGLIYQAYSDLTLNDVVMTGGYTTNGPGGAIYSQESQLTVTDSTIIGNTAITTAGTGGAIQANDTSAQPRTSSLTISDTTIADNKAIGDGGGVLSNGVPNVRIERSTVSGNTAAAAASIGGGVVFNAVAGTLAVSDSTFSGNSAGADGGAMVLRAGTVRIDNTTIAGNSVKPPAPAGTSGGIRRTGTPNQTTISSSILADNTPSDLSSASAASPVAVGSSLIEAPVSGGAILESPLGSNVTGVDPQLGPLAANGGPTLTQALPASSPAIDKGVANGLGTDQRGLARSSGAGTDMGAFEFQVDSSIDAPNVSAKKTQKVKGSKVRVVVDAGAGEAVQLSATGSVSPPKKTRGRIVRKGKKPVAFKRVTGSAAAGATSKLTLVPAKKSAGRKLARALAKGGKAKASIEVVLKDAAGNTDTEKVTVTLKGSKKKK